MAKNNAAIKQLDKDLADIQSEIQAETQAETQGTAVNDSSVTVGTVMEDGSVFAGTTESGILNIYALPKDIGFTATFNDAAKAVQKLNEKKVLGHDDWQIPDLDTLKVLQRNQNQGSLKGTFNTTDKGSGADFPDWYWSSTEHPDYSSSMYLVRLSDGNQLWDPKDNNRLSCRPVRLVP